MTDSRYVALRRRFAPAAVAAMGPPVSSPWGAEDSALYKIAGRILICREKCISVAFCNETCISALCKFPFDAPARNPLESKRALGTAPKKRRARHWCGALL